MTKEFLLHKEKKKEGNPAHIQAHLAVPTQGRLLRSQKSLHLPTHRQTVESSNTFYIEKRDIENL